MSEAQGSAPSRVSSTERAFMAYLAKYGTAKRRELELYLGADRALTTFAEVRRARISLLDRNWIRSGYMPESGRRWRTYELTEDGRFQTESAAVFTHTGETA
jgi:hypothetical protein